MITATTAPKNGALVRVRESTFLSMFNGLMKEKESYTLSKLRLNSGVHRRFLVNSVLFNL